MKTIYYLMPMLLLTVLSTSVVSVIAVTPIVEQVTGGGWILDPCTGKKKTFGFVAMQLEDCTLKGNVQYVDHGTKLNVHGYDITALTITGNEAWIQGICRLNGDRTPRPFCVYVRDEDEPGKYDWFEINIPSISYFASAELGVPDDAGGGGNIQIHRPPL